MARGQRTAEGSGGVGQWVPGVRTLRIYRRSWLPRDVVAGIVLTALLVPAGMGYAEASGLPAIYGLYATIVPLVVYAILGVSQYRSRSRETSGSAAGFILFAALMMIIGGIFQALQGLAGIVENEFYVTTRNYVFEADATTWGWTHLIIGVIVGLAGLALLSGQTWARVVGIFLAVLSAISNFLFIPYYPLWSLLIIALDVFVIWALAAHGGELRDTGGI